MYNREQSQKRKQMYMSIFVVIILVLSTFAFVLSFKAPTQDFSYNGFEFTQKNNQWITEITTPLGEKEYSFYTHPSELWMDLSPEITAKIKQFPTITIAFDPTIEEIQYVEVARFQLIQFLATDLGKNVHSAVTNTTTLYDFPVETCTPNSDSLFISFTQNNQSTASVDGNCIHIYASDSMDFIRYAEKIIYQLLGVI